MMLLEEAVDKMVRTGLFVPIHAEQGQIALDGSGIRVKTHHNNNIKTRLRAILLNQDAIGSAHSHLIGSGEPVLLFQLCRLLLPRSQTARDSSGEGGSDVIP
jgi:hypothetical protein